MVDVRSERCYREGCSKAPSFGLEGSRKARVSLQNAEEGVVEVIKRRRSRKGWSKRPSFRWEGKTMLCCCSLHVMGAMVDVSYWNCVHPAARRFDESASRLADVESQVTAKESDEKHGV